MLDEVVKIMRVFTFLWSYDVNYCPYNQEE